MGYIRFLKGLTMFKREAGENMVGAWVEIRVGKLEYNGEESWVARACYICIKMDHSE